MILIERSELQAPIFLHWGIVPIPPGDTEVFLAAAATVDGGRSRRGTEEQPPGRERSPVQAKDGAKEVADTSGGACGREQRKTVLGAGVSVLLRKENIGQE